MIVEENLEWVNDHWVREGGYCVWPHVQSFAEFAALIRSTGCLVTTAPEIDGHILDQDGGMPFRLYYLEDLQSGFGAVPFYKIFWSNPDWLHFTPGTVMPPLGQVIEFRRSTRARGGNHSPHLRHTSGSSQADARIIERPYTPAEYEKQFGAASGGGRKSRKAQRRGPRI